VPGDCRILPKIVPGLPTKCINLRRACRAIFARSRPASWIASYCWTRPRSSISTWTTVSSEHAPDDNLWVNYQLSDLEQGLNEFNFFRAHRASLVNLRRVKEIRPSPRSAFLLIMDDTARTRIEVSERQARVLRSIIPGL
jgi:hypothetical protein